MGRVSNGRSGNLLLTLANGGTLSWREYGDPKGSPLVFFHGWPGSSAQGIFLHRAGLENGLRIVSMDRPGLGESSPIPERTFLHIPPLVEELAEALDLGPYDVLGMSGGGPYALACAWALPHRVRRTVVCCGAPPIDSPEARRRYSPVYRALMGVHDRFPGVLKSALAPVTLAGRIRPPWPLMRLVSLFMKPKDKEFLSDRTRFDQFYPSLRNAMRSGHKAIYDDGRCYSLPWPFEVSEIRVPVRIWHGTQDTNFHHSLAEKLASRIPGAAFFLREQGHYSLPAFCTEEIIADLLACKAPR
jgi:pimeloyl-ACP methyl ester carboxylesterase